MHLRFVPVVIVSLALLPHVPAAAQSPSDQGVEAVVDDPAAAPTDAFGQLSAGPGAVDDPGADTAALDGPPVVDHDPMSWFGIGLRGGVGFWGTRNFESALQDSLENNGFEDSLELATELDAPLPQTANDMRVGGSQSAIFALPINLGGLAFFRFEPFVGFGDFTSVGSYLGLGFNIHIKRFYVEIGVGGLGDVMLDRRFDVAGDLFLRVPVDVYWYQNDSVGWFLEVAGAGGLSVAKPAGVADATLATGTLFDVSLGARVP